MIKYIKILIFSLILINCYNFSYGSEVYFVEIKKILNTSKAGKQAQGFLKKKFDKNTLHGKKQSGVESFYPRRTPKDNEIKPNSVISEIKKEEINHFIKKILTYSTWVYIFFKLNLKKYI